MAPEDFGLAALAFSVVALSESFIWLGLFAALIQHSNPQRKHYDTVWTLNLILHSLVAAIVFSAAPTAAAYYNEPRVETLLQILALGPVLRGLTNIGVVDFRRDMRFDWEVGYRLSVRMLTFFITVPVALLLGDYRALIVGVLSQAFFSLVLSYALHPYRPRLNLKNWREFIHFSIWSSINSIGNTLTRQAGRIVVGKYTGVASSGFYSVAEDIVRIFTAEFSSAITTSLLSSASKIKSDVSRMASAKVKSAGGIAIIVMPIGIGMAATSRDMIDVFLGSQWTVSAPLLQVLAIAWTFDSVAMFASPLMVAEGRVKTLGIMSICKAGLFIVTIAFFSDSLSPIMVAYLFLAVASFSLVLAILVSVKLDLAQAGALLLALGRPLFASIIMYSAIVVSHGSVFAWSLPSLAFDIAIGAIIYSCLILLIWYVAGRPNSAEKAIIGQLIMVSRGIRDGEKRSRRRG